MILYNLEHLYQIKDFKEKIFLIPPRFDYNLHFLNSVEKFYYVLTHGFIDSFNCNDFEKLYTFPSLYNDILYLKNIFADFLEREPSFKFEILKENACKLFHEDYIEWRLICTYFGPGTEYVDDESIINREIMCQPWTDPDQQNHLIVTNWNMIKSLPAGWAAIMRGKKGDKNNQGLIHRSPEIESKNLIRIVLTLN